MEVSSMSSETTSAGPTSTSSSSKLSPPPASAPSSITTTSTTTASQLLYNDVNLQSHPQKPPTAILMTNNDNLNSSKPFEGANNLASCKNSNHDNNRNESSTVIGNPNKDLYGQLNNKEPLTERSGAKHDEELDQAMNLIVKTTLNLLIDRIVSELLPAVTATSSQSTIFCSTNEPVTEVALITPVVDEDEAGVTKDIVTLRNLEITPPPQSIKNDETPSTTTNTTPDVQNNPKSARKRKIERTHSETTEQSDESSSGRSKRQRKQTELFQVVANTTPRPSLGKKESSSKKVQSRIPRFQPKQAPKSGQKQPTRVGSKIAERPPVERPRDFQDVICYEKNDYLAIRNEENTFYICQLTENVRVQKPYVKIRWLDSTDGGKTYFSTAHYDKIPQKSIIMPVLLNKLENNKGKAFFSIDQEIRESVMERLKRSLNVPTEIFE